MRKKLSDILFNFKVLFKKKSYGPKIFCIGYNKTGTTSLGRSLKMLGYDHSSFNKIVWRKHYKQDKIERVISYTAKFDSFDDLPWLKEDMIPLLDKTFPNSKFIYLTREEESWKKSYENWTEKVTGKRPNGENGWKKYKFHESFVLEYFKNWSDEKFITLQIKDPQGFKKLADFLGKETEIVGFPHFNKT